MFNSGCTVLIASTPDWTSLLEETFSDRARHVCVVSGLADILPFLAGNFQRKELPAHLIVLDTELDESVALGILEQIRLEPTFKKIPVVVLFPEKTSGLTEKCYDIHANCCIAKRYDPEGRLKIVRALKNFWLSVAKLPTGS
jgi:response regulator RpfG family c-di-GMP phosphodiesterase